jgi:hypothetical protein
MQGAFKASSHIGIGESTNMVLTCHHCLEQLNVVSGKRIKCSYPATGCGLLSCSDIVELLDCRRRVVHNGQRIQVSVVRLPGDFPVAEKISNTLLPAAWQPIRFALCCIYNHYRNPQIFHKMLSKQRSRGHGLHTGSYQKFMRHLSRKIHER